VLGLAKALQAWKVFTVSFRICRERGMTVSEHLEDILDVFSISAARHDLIHYWIWRG
jgi:hypothetical protein